MSSFFSCKQLLTLGALLIIPAAASYGQSTAATDSTEKSATLSTFDPTPSLVVPFTNLTKAKYPVIDIHSHFGIRLKGDRAALQNYLAQMSANQIAISISLDAVPGSEEDHLGFIHNDGANSIVAFAPKRQDLLLARNRILKRHPETIFIGAHCANSSEDLKQLWGLARGIPQSDDRVCVSHQRTRPPALHSTKILYPISKPYSFCHRWSLA